MFPYVLTVLLTALLMTVAAYPLHLWRLKVVFMAGTRILTEQVAELRVGIDTERDKTSRYFTAIDGIKKERDDWHQLYTGQAIGHGNAQNLMMGEIEKLARALAAKGVRYSMPRVLQEVREEYLGKYEMPARADTPLAAIDVAAKVVLTPPVDSIPDEPA